MQGSLARQLAPHTYHEPLPELGRLPYLAENHGVEDDDGEVRDHLDQQELGPEDVVRDVVLPGRKEGETAARSVSYSRKAPIRRKNCFH